MTNESYISLHRHDDVDALALKGAPEGVDLPYCLQQIKGWQTACRKLPRWAEVEGLVFPPSLSMEQCSSQPTAAYKQALAERLLPPGRRRARTWRVLASQPSLPFAETVGIAGFVTVIVNGK